MGFHRALASRLAPAAACLLAVALAAGPAVGGPISQRSDELREAAPDDPEFDCNEPDDPQRNDPFEFELEPFCATVWDEQHHLFGFAPASTAETALYRDPAHLAAGETAQVSGVSADEAWSVWRGSPDATVAVLDTGIRWDDPDIRPKVRLNAGELPAGELTARDADGDGVVTVGDFDGDPRFGPAPTGLDLVRFFEDGTDDDGNGYVDDIAGWDFFDDDNDPADVSSYSSARNHGTGRAEEAVQVTDDGRGEAGVCPECSLMPLRLWDSFVVIGDQYGMAMTYAADSGVAATVVALGVMQNTRTAKAATRYAFEKGVALTTVSSDLNTANHNYPTNYHETIFVNGCVADTHGLGEDFAQLSELLNRFGLSTQAPVGTWFRNSNLTQYGAHAHVCFVGTTGSVATGQAGGGAALIASAGRHFLDWPLTSNEVKQLLAMTAEDVLPENTLGTGTPDPAQPGWDERFGYGRADLGAAVKAVRDGRVPPEAWIDSPAFWSLLDPLAEVEVEVRGHVGAERSSGWRYELQWAPGIEPPDGDFRTFASGEGGGGARDGLLGVLRLGDVAAAVPGAIEGLPPEEPNDRAFTVRLVVVDADGNRGEDRKAYFAHHDPTAHEGWPRFVDTGGETSPVLYDLDGDGTLEVVEANSSGELTVTRHDGTPLPSFNGGEPWVLPPTPGAHLDAPGFASGAVPPPNGGFRTPAVADVDGDLAPEMVVAAVDGRLFVIGAGGAVEHELGVDPSLSAVERRTACHHVKRGFWGAPSVGDLDGDGGLEIVAGALDGHVYAWSGRDGSARPGFPVMLADPDHPVDLACGDGAFAGGELISTPALADLDGDGDAEIVSESSEVYGESVDVPSSGDDFPALFERFADGSGLDTFGRAYAVESDGSFVDGWPVPVGGLLPDILPLVAPAMTVAAADFDGDGDDEVVAGVVSGVQRILDGDGSEVRQLREQGPVWGGDSGEVQHVNLAEYPVVGDLDGDGDLEVTKGGATLNTVLNLLLVGQNLPYDHLVKAWDAGTGEFVPGFPRPIEDYTILSTPAIADVGGLPGREIVVGSGLYLMHAYGVAGVEAPGFPKLTGGWTFPVAAVDDVDGDGMLELAGATREGWRFLWDLDAPAVPGANEEWWTEAHDACHTNRHGTDCRPPSAASDLSLEGRTLSFTVPGDDFLVGTADRVEVRVSQRPVDSFEAWEAATPVEGVAAPGPSGTGMEVLLPPRARSAAVVVFDEAGNGSRIAAVTRGGGPGAPLPDPGPPDTPPDTPPGGPGHSQGNGHGNEGATDLAATPASSRIPVPALGTALAALAALAMAAAAWRRWRHPDTPRSG